ncbi:ADP-ribosylation/Crystallin J1, partial [Cladorrhinum sp. PSN259]
LHDHAVGVMIGSALGDAIGLYTEFMTKQEVVERYGSGVQFSLYPTPTVTFWVDDHRSTHTEGEWSDDTDQAIILLLAFLREVRGNHRASGRDMIEGQISRGTRINLPSQQEVTARLRIWINNGTMALGTLPIGLDWHTWRVNSQARFLREPRAITRYGSASNGALMRTHPLGIMTAFRDEAAAFKIGSDIAKVTHYDPRCVVSCIIGTALVRSVVRGDIYREEHIDDLINRAVAWYLANETDADARGRFRRAELDRHVKKGALKELKIDESEAVGYTYICLACGISALRLALRMVKLSESQLSEREIIFEHIINDLIMRGGFADTNACFAGALLGGYLGWTALPKHWKRGLIRGDWLKNKSEELCQALGFKPGTYDGDADPDAKRLGGKPRQYTQAEMNARRETHRSKQRIRIAARKAHYGGP